jgi:hypothetical protein
VLYKCAHLCESRDGASYIECTNTFEDENEKNENVSHAKNAKHDNLRTNHSIDDEFNSRDFFDDMNDERDFETLYS